jgi:hypothetical protein
MLMLKEQKNLLLIRWIFEISRTHFKLTAQITNIFYISSGAGVIVIIWEFDLQLLMQSMPIPTKVVSLNPTHGEVYIHNTTLCDKVWPWLAAGQWFSLGSSVSSTNETDRHNITEILLNVALSTITLTQYFIFQVIQEMVYSS